MRVPMRRMQRFLTSSRAVTLIAIVVILTIIRLHSSTTASSATNSSDVLSPSGRRVAIVTFTTRELSYTHLSLKNKQAYTRKHGYDLIVDYEPSEERGLMWHKFVMLERVIAAGKHDWVWWIDFDTLVTNTSIKLTDVIAESLADSPHPELVDFILTPDCFPLNAGSMILRSHQRTLDFLNLIRSYGDTHTDLSEQDCLRDMIDSNQHDEDKRVLMILQSKINAFPEEIRCWANTDRGWEPGTFVIHFAGAWAHLDVEDPTGYLMRKYEAYIDQ